MKHKGGIPPERFKRSELEISNPFWRSPCLKIKQETLFKGSNFDKKLNSKGSDLLEN